jgi:two-component system OmpR family response regulator
MDSSGNGLNALQRELATAPVAPTVLIVEDDPALRTLLMRLLREEGFQPLSAAHGGEMARVLETNTVDIILLDVMMPGSNGFQLCRSLRKESDVPIVMLSARDDESDRLIGLELGADDYITKPFSPRELVARVRAVLRRSEGDPAPGGVIHSGGLSIDLERRSVRRDGEPIDLTATEFDLLAVMAREPGRPFTRAQLLELAYDVSYAGYDRTVDAHIKNLRRKIEPDSHTPQYILTIYGVGYKFAEPS